MVKVGDGGSAVFVEDGEGVSVRGWNGVFVRVGLKSGVGVRVAVAVCVAVTVPVCEPVGVTVGV
jgi:hypothetical protein